MDELTLTDDEKSVELEACERRIFSAFRRGLEAKYDLGKELVTIDSRQLYEVRGYRDLLGYTKDVLRMDDYSTNSCMGIYRAIKLLEDAGVSELPSNESQILALAQAPQNKLVDVWNKLRDTCERNEVPVTVDRVKKAVNLEHLEAKPRPGVKTQVSIEQEPMSEVGERALTRIRRICGEQISEAIKSGARALTERAIIRWAELQDQAMRELIYYVIDQGWSVAEAINYEERTVSGNSTLAEITLRARARGGHLRIQHEEFLVNVERAA